MKLFMMKRSVHPMRDLAFALTGCNDSDPTPRMHRGVTYAAVTSDVCVSGSL